MQKKASWGLCLKRPSNGRRWPKVCFSPYLFGHCDSCPLKRVEAGQLNWMECQCVIFPQHRSQKMFPE